MGLKLSYEMSTGVTADHWSIAHNDIDYKNQSGHTLLLVYKDAAAKSGGKSPLGRVKISWPDVGVWPFVEVTMKELNKTDRTVAYEAIKAHVTEEKNDLGLDFTTATDED